MKIKEWILRRILAIGLATTIVLSGSLTSCAFLPFLAGRTGNSTEATTKTSSKEATSETKASGTEADGNESKAVKALRAIDLELFTDVVTSDTVTLHLTLKDPKALGIESPAVTLGSFSPELAAQDTEKYNRLLKELDKIPYEELPTKEQRVYDIIKYSLEENLAFEPFYYYGSSFNSITGIQSQLPLILAEFPFDSKEDIDDYLLLVQDVRRYYKDLLSFEQERATKGLLASDKNIQKIIDSCNAFLKEDAKNTRANHFMVTSFAERLEGVEGLDEAQKSAYIKDNQKALDDYLYPAYQDLVDGFTALLGSGKNEGGLSAFPEGKEYYSVLLQSEGSTDATPEVAAELLENTIDDLIDEIQSINMDDKFESLYESYDFTKGSVQENLDYCKAAIKKDFPELIDHNVTLREVPPQLEEFFSPAAYLSCRIDDPTENLILTNAYALKNSKDLLGTVAHEGYPGHLFQNVYHAVEIESLFQRSGSFKGFSEGWARYAEDYIKTHSDFDQSVVSYVTIEDTIFNLLLPARIDIGVNYEGWDLAQTEKFLESYNLNLPEYAAYSYDMAIEIPGYFMAYALGEINVNQILDEAKDTLENQVSLKEIHTAFLDLGPGPFPILDKYMDEYVEEQKN